ncbi:hypothetical protein PybrP1_012016 [[Pythium] brassicae (nom. inval.)]|nr:hypothetical protein PybrP1_012016 [[Pythium] brassicae (nom. inval.)]
MGDAVRRVQRHLQELARDNFAHLEASHGANVDWLRAELAELARDVGVALRLELKRPLPATFRSEYAFAAKRARVETPPRASEPTIAAASAPEPTTAAASAPEPTTAAPAPATTTVTRTHRVLRPKAAAAQKKTRRRERLDPVNMKVVELRAELKRRGRKAAGLKAVLIDRLLDAMEEEDEEDESDADAGLEFEEVEEAYEADVVVVEDEDEDDEDDARMTEAVATQQQSGDEIVRESLDPLSQRSSTQDETSRSQAQLATDITTSASKKKRPRAAFAPNVAPIDERGDETETLQKDDDAGAAAAASAPGAASTKSAAKWAFLANALRRNVSSVESAPSVRSGVAATLDALAGEADVSVVSIDARKSDTAGDMRSTESGVVEAANRVLDTDAEAEQAERKASLKVSFATTKDENVTALDSQAPTTAAVAAEDSVSRLRSTSLPQTSVSASAADPVTPNGQRTTDELAVARSEPAPGASDETNEQRPQRGHQLTIEQEAQRLRLAAKLSAKKRFEEAMLSSSFWAKRDRLKTQQVQLDSVVAQPRENVPAPANEQTSSSAPKKLSIKLEPEPEASATEPQFNEAASPASDTRAAAQPPLKPELAARSKPVEIPFSSSSRRFSDPSRRVSASRRRESASSRRDSVSSRRNSLTRRRDSGDSTLSSGSTKSSGDSEKPAAAAPRKPPTNLVSGLHSFTSLIEKENATVASSSAARSAPVVSALKQAEKSRLLEQKKTLEKLKRKEAMKKRYEEQRKLDDDKKKKAVSVKEKAEREAKLKREQDKLNEKKQREMELAKHRHQKLQEMRAGLEKKRAMMAAEKQAGVAAKLAAAAPSASSASASLASSSTRRTSTSSVSSQAVARPATASQPQSQKLVVTASHAPLTKPAASVAKPVKPSASAQAVKASASIHAASATTVVAKGRPTDTSTYDMSDNGESSSGGDGDSSDDERKHNKKNIPRWARKENLERILRVQFGPNASDPSPAIFPDFVDTCDLEAIFQPTDAFKQRRFQKRSSSGNWFGDRPTAREKAVYKRDMGYLR